MPHTVQCLNLNQNVKILESATKFTKAGGRERRTPPVQLSAGWFWHSRYRHISVCSVVTTLLRFSLAQPINSSFKTSTPSSAKADIQLFLQHLTLTTFRMSFLITEKIRTIRKKIPPPNPTACPDTSFAGNPLLSFESVTNEFVLKIISSGSAKSCELDPIPTTLLYENLDILLPTITNIINTSLTTGIVPPDLKTAVVKPLLKKSHHLTKTFWKTTVPFLTHLFCPKFLKRSFSTNFSPISRKATSAIPFSQPIEQDAALRPFCYVL